MLLIKQPNSKWNHLQGACAENENGSLLWSAPVWSSYLHGGLAVEAVVEVEIGGGVVGPVCDSQVAIADAAVQLLCHRDIL